MRRAFSTIAVVGFIVALSALVMSTVAVSVAAAEVQGQIFGTVTPTAVAAEVEVCMVETQPAEICASPGADGKYDLTGLPTGRPFEVEFIPSYRSRYQIQYFENARTQAQATKIALAPIAPTKENVDAQLVLGGAIEGMVTASSGGTPLAEVEVCVLDAGRRVPLGCAETRENGLYALGGLPAGTYKLGFFGRGGSAIYAPQYYAKQSTLGSGTAVTLTEGATLTGIDAAMVKGAQVSGAVTIAASGLPLEGTPVCLFDAAASTPMECTYSGLGGSYSLVGLPAGSYQVGFSLSSMEVGGEAVSSGDDGYLSQYYAFVPSRAEARTLTLSGEQVASGVDAQLLTPPLAPPLIPSPPLASNVVAAPPVITEPIKSTKPKPSKCKKGYVRKKVKGVGKCVKKISTKKHRKQPKNHGKAGR